MEPDERATNGRTPLPASATVWVVGLALSARVSVADSAPFVLGLKVRLTEQVLEAASVVPLVQLAPEAMAKSAAFGPLRAGAALKVKSALPVFVAVTVMALLVSPTVWLPKLTLGGASETPAATPVPLSAMVCVVGEASSVMVAVADSLPVTEGLNEIASVQVA